MIKFFEEFPVLALISDGSVDFNTVDFDAPLSLVQQKYLKQATGLDIPQVFWRKQVHEDGIIVASGVLSDCRKCPDADAFVTNKKGLPMAIRTADCVPVFLYDPLKNVIGLAHAGWKGTKVEIAGKTVKTMLDKFKCQGHDIRAVIGPCIRSCCYQVGEEFRKDFPEDIAERDGHLYVDVAATNRRQLVNAGVKEEHILDAGICTYCNLDYFSFRRDAEKSGRMISLMMIL